MRADDDGNDQTLLVGYTEAAKIVGMDRLNEAICVGQDRAGSRLNDEARSRGSCSRDRRWGTDGGETPT